MSFENVLRKYVSRGMVCRNQRREEDTRPVWISDFLTGVVSALSSEQSAVAVVDFGGHSSSEIRPTPYPYYKCVAC
jgi:hypothetical protein